MSKREMEEEEEEDVVETVDEFIADLSDMEDGAPNTTFIVLCTHMCLFKALTQFMTKTTATKNRHMTLKKVTTRTLLMEKEKNQAAKTVMRQPSHNEREREMSRKRPVHQLPGLHGVSARTVPLYWLLLTCELWINSQESQSRN